MSQNSVRHDTTPLYGARPKSAASKPLMDQACPSTPKSNAEEYGQHGQYKEADTGRNRSRSRSFIMSKSRSRSPDQAYANQVPEESYSCHEDGSPHASNAQFPGDSPEVTDVRCNEDSRPRDHERPYLGSDSSVHRPSMRPASTNAKSMIPTTSVSLATVSGAHVKSSGPIMELCQVIATVPGISVSPRPRSHFVNSPHPDLSVLFRRDAPAIAIPQQTAEEPLVAEDASFADTGTVDDTPAVETCTDALGEANAVKFSNFKLSVLNGVYFLDVEKTCNAKPTYWNIDESYFLYHQYEKRRWAIVETKSGQGDIMYTKVSGDARCADCVAAHSTDTLWHQVFNGAWTVGVAPMISLTAAGADSARQAAQSGSSTDWSGGRNNNASAWESANRKWGDKKSSWNGGGNKWKAQANWSAKSNRDDSKRTGGGWKDESQATGDWKEPSSGADAWNTKEGGNWAGSPQKRAWSDPKTGWEAGAASGDGKADWRH